jgi:hypothetical protein
MGGLSYSTPNGEPIMSMQVRDDDLYILTNTEVYRVLIEKDTISMMAVDFAKYMMDYGTA